MAYVRRQKTSKRKRGQRPLILTVATIIVVAALVGGAWWVFLRKDASTTGNNTSTGNKTASGIDLSPPTKQEISDTEQHKDDLSNDNNTPATPVTNTVTPIINYAGQYGGTIEVSASIPTIVEDGGACTLTATKGSSTITKQVEALKNAQNTVCSSFSVSRGEMGAGTWSITVMYKSAAHSGTSASQSLEVT